MDPVVEDAGCEGRRMWTRLGNVEMGPKLHVKLAVDPMPLPCVDLVFGTDVNWDAPVFLCTGVAGPKLSPLLVSGFPGHFLVI